MPDVETPGRSPRSRWISSQVTFGPVGRIVATLICLMPVWWFWHVGLFGLVGLAIWCLFVLPVALRDIWRPVRVPGSRQHLPADPATPPQPTPDDERILNRQAPSRW